MRIEHVIVGVARDDVGTDAGPGEDSADSRCQAYRLKSGMDLQGDPGRDELVRQVQPFGLLLARIRVIPSSSRTMTMGSTPAGTPVRTCV